MTDVIVIDKTKALDLLTKQVDKYGEDHASRCVYFEYDGTPSCIIGNILADLGMTKEEMWIWNSTTLDGIVNPEKHREGVVNPLKDRIEFTPDALNILCEAQQVQDDFGRTWGDALKRARQVA